MSTAKPVVAPWTPAKECFAAGQGLGAIVAVVPAADIVREFVDVAERTLTRAGDFLTSRG